MGAAKTFGVMDLAGSTMTATPFAGRDISERGGVLFIAAEGAEEVSIRMRAIVEHKLMNKFTQTEIDPSIDLSCLPFTSIRRPVRFSTPDGYAEMMKIAEIAQARMEREYKVPLKLIIIDTMQASVDFKDGNDSAENQRVMNCLGGIARETGATTLIVDHFGKAVESGTKGSSSKEDFAFFVLAFLADRDISGEISNTRMSLRKIRSGKAGALFPFNLTTVDMGDDETTCIIEWKQEQGDGRDTSKKDKWTGALAVFRTSITTAIIDSGGEKYPYGNAGPLVRAVPLDKVKNEFCSAYPATNSVTPEAKADAKRKAFERSVKQARARSLIGSRDISGTDYLWLVQEDEAGYLKKRGKPA
jgi:AAA domain